jgi:hypothetical protein
LGLSFKVGKFYQIGTKRMKGQRDDRMGTISGQERSRSRAHIANGVEEFGTQHQHDNYYFNLRK